MVQHDREIEHEVVNKEKNTCLTINIAYPVDKNLLEKEEKQARYDDLNWIISIVKW